MISNRLHNKLKNRRYSSDDRISIMDAVMENHGEIDFMPAHSLDAAATLGGTTYDAMVIFDASSEFSLRRDLAQAPTLLPVQERGFSRYHYMYHIDAGVKSFLRMQCLIVYIPRS